MVNQKQVKRIHILNKFGPQDNAITGRSAAQLGSELLRAGHQVSFFCIKDSYKMLGQAITEQNKYHIIGLKKISFGDQGKRRLATALLDGLRLTLRSLFTKADFVIVMTDPPLINIWSSLFRIFSRRKILFWTMDLYPDAFASSGIISADHYLYKWLSRRIYSHAPNGLVALGGQQLTYLQEKYQKNIPAIILPCGIESIIKDKAPPVWIAAEDEKKIKFCYAGNIGEAHDELFLIAFIKALNPHQHVIYINLYGAKAKAVLSEIENCPAVKKINYLSYGQMHFMDVHVASLLRQWDNVCVPSKAVSAICAGAILLLNCSKQCDGWKMFSNACWLIEQKTGNYERDIDLFLRSLTCKQIALKKQNALTLAERLQAQERNAYATALKWIETGV